jgi:hypothetical protein
MISDMLDLDTFDRLAQEEKKQASRRKFTWALLLAFLLASAVDYALNWSKSSAIQRQIEQTLNGYPLPQDTRQFDFGSGHAPRHGWATRAVVSPAAPRSFCDFYISTLISDGWHLETSDCIPRSTEMQGWPDVDKGHSLLQFRRGRYTFRLRYFGYQNSLNVYRLTLSWRP